MTTGANQILALIQTVTLIQNVFATVFARSLNDSLPEGELKLLLLLSVDSITS